MVDGWLESLKKGELIPERDVKILCDYAKELLMEESNVVPVSAPVIICGDIHGQFYDLLELFNIGGQIPDKKYLFMGDYVDRGYHSVETILLLLCYKIKYPGHITLLRGNHESRSICSNYGFYEEINRKYGNTNAWNYLNEIFDYLPIGALVEGKIFCVHGGLSPLISTADQIRLLKRNQEIPHEGAFCDLMWSDPDDIETWIMSSRGAGYIFGWRVVKEFCRINNLDLICRAHQLVQEGYKYWFSEQNLVTVWSVPNYCYRCGNDASILCIDDNMNRDFKIFQTVDISKNSESYKTQVPYFL
ncbi:MAG: serine/threonine-protein phosphatase [archaeon]|nr:serine/threonine-protein phosphatase [archaeon]